MKSIARSLVIMLVALIAVPALAVSVTLTAAVQLLAVTGFYMGGTQHPLSTPPDDPSFITNYMNLADQQLHLSGYRNRSRRSQSSRRGLPRGVLPGLRLDDLRRFGRRRSRQSVQLPQWWSVQWQPGWWPRDPARHTSTFSATRRVPSSHRSSRATHHESTRATAPADTNFILIANPMRPNGGILGRGFEGLTIPIFGITFYGPTQNSCDTRSVFGHR